MRVSHSRDFIDEFCTHILVITDEGKAHIFEGKLEDYQRAAKIQGIQDLLSKTVSDNTVTGAESPKVETESKISNDKIKELKKRETHFQKS